MASEAKAGGPPVTPPLQITLASISDQLTLAAIDLPVPSVTSGAAVSWSWVVVGPGGDETANVIAASNVQDAGNLDPSAASAHSGGEWTVIVTATDASGNTATAAQSFTLGRWDSTRKVYWVLHQSLDITAEASFNIKTTGAWTDSNGLVWTPNDTSRATSWDVTNGTGLVLVTNTVLSAKVSTPASAAIPSLRIGDKVAFITQRRGNDGIASAQRMTGYGSTSNNSQLFAGVTGANEDTLSLSRDAASNTVSSAAHGGTEQVQHGVMMDGQRGQTLHGAGVTWPASPADLSTTKSVSIKQTVGDAAIFVAASDSLVIQADSASGSTDVVEKYAIWRAWY